MSNMAQKTQPKQKSSLLTEKSVREIRTLNARAGGGWNAKSLARVFSTTEVAISAVINRTGSYKD